VRTIAVGGVGSAIVLSVAYALTSFFFGSPTDLVHRFRGEELLVDPSAISIPEGNAGDVRQVTVELRNIIDRTITVYGGSSDCSCFFTTALPVEVPSHQTVTLSLTVKYKGTPGLFSRTFIFYADTALRYLRLTVVGQINESS